MGGRWRFKTTEEREADYDRMRNYVDTHLDLEDIGSKDELQKKISDFLDEEVFHRWAGPQPRRDGLPSILPSLVESKANLISEMAGRFEDRIVPVERVVVRRRWTESENEYLRDRRKMGWNYRRISGGLKERFDADRSVGSLYSKMWRLRRRRR